MNKKHFSIILLLFSTFLHANVELPMLFSDGMVLQRNKPITVWGWAEPNETISILFKDKKTKTKANKFGKWTAELKAEKAGGPFNMTIKGKNTIVLSDVLIGDVWICSGQSNMGFTVNRALNFTEELKDSDYPLIRQFLVNNDMNHIPKEKIKSTQWKLTNHNTLAEFTAVGYFFAKKLHKELGIPIGIINTSWSGTCIETWISKEAFESSDEFIGIAEKIPTVDINIPQENKIKILTNRIEKIQGSKVDNLQEDFFKKKAFNDSNWPEINAPEFWETQELGDLDGTVWMRKSILISKEDTENEALLELAKIDDQDITYVNGVEVGTTNSYNKKRRYKINKNILKEGVNTIAIKITDYQNGGGIWGEKSDLKLTLKNNTIELSGKWKYKVVSVLNSKVSPNKYPSVLYNAMINPLTSYAIHGVLWYQGESNASRAHQYKTAFPLLIQDWRNKWNQGDFPFYFVQLSSFNEANGNSNKGSQWAELREAQDFTNKTVKNTEMVVTTDIGNPTDIHPKNKQDVGKRLAAIVLNKPYNSPTYRSMEIKGDKIILTFDGIGDGLTTTDKYGYLKGFEIAGEDKVFHFAKAYIENGKVVVYNKNIPNPKAVHYGWSDDAGECNLYNKENFPAAPFRTDNWKTITLNNKYTVN
ncbi:hypothetical protein BW723_09635 [Polaribacter reichenbachii]|uniref:Sialate O-acetylesterase domain-containing protein n=1 Tax=Polaribacter reichenbachii TaxID=996801 RepID=A0A1B8U3A9_9FLAO|nr:sialate O-acetylesterase [Polaribacter reichenbachii]APZ46533.1 hypothetical protein BW723_09635 [Polaribacter reichenbachii]AUC17180.1 hypothetical protein BTO17_00085 [Polaribacter reichenbachii]OBY66357.1 hypothetical protein LPB301_06600 [Polaribacter reichenbachii]